MTVFGVGLGIKRKTSQGEMIQLTLHMQKFCVNGRSTFFFEILSSTIILGSNYKSQNGHCLLVACAVDKETVNINLMSYV